MPAPPWAFVNSAVAVRGQRGVLRRDNMILSFTELQQRELDSRAESCTVSSEPSQSQATATPASLVGRVTGKLTSTVTVTTTVFSSGSVTSTMYQGATTASNIQSTTTGSPAESTKIFSSTTTTTVFVFRATSSATATNSSASTLSSISTNSAFGGGLNNTSVTLDPARHAATVTGAVLGSMALVGVISALLWFCCLKNKSRREKVKERIKLDTIVAKIKRQTPIEHDTIELENHKQNQRDDDDQKLMEETRAIMLKQKAALKMVEAGNDSRANLIDAAAQPGMSSASSLPFTMQALATQAAPTERLTEPLEMPAPLCYVSHDTSSTHSSSVSPSANRGMIPRRQPLLKPAPILTAPQHIYQPERLSPLSPRAMFHAVSGAVKRLSPGGSSSNSSSNSRGTGLGSDGRGGFEALLGEDGKLKHHASSSNGSSLGRTKSKLGKWI